MPYFDDYQNRTTAYTLNAFQIFSYCPYFETLIMKNVVYESQAVSMNYTKIIDNLLITFTLFLSLRNFFSLYLRLKSKAYHLNTSRI